MQKEEQRRVNQFLSGSEEPFRLYDEMEDQEKEARRNADRIERERKRSIQADILALDREMELMAAEEKRLEEGEPQKSTEASQPSQEDVSPEINDPEQQSPNDTLSVDPFAEITDAKHKDSLPVFPEEEPEQEQNTARIVQEKVGYSRFKFSKHAVGENALVRRMRWGH
jgi:folylpolyglutamate synthase